MGGGMALTGTGTRWRNQGPPSPSSTNFSNHICVNKKDSCLNSLLFSVPSSSEVQFAISSLQSLMQGIPTRELSWVHPVLSPSLTLSPGFHRLKDALLLLQTNQSIQRLVLSLCSDKSVWDAVLQNKFLRQLKESLSPACLEGSPDQNKEPDPLACIGRWILDLMKAKVLELVDKFKSLVDDIFESAPQKDRMTAESRECLEEKLKSSVLLSIIILFIVDVTRASHLP